MVHTVQNTGIPRLHIVTKLGYSSNGLIRDEEARAIEGFLGGHKNNKIYVTTDLGGA